VTKVTFAVVVFMNRFLLALKSLRQLGLQQVGFYALYKLGLATGHYRRTENREQGIENGVLCPLFTFPTRAELSAVLGGDGKAALLAEADEIVAGKVRLFGGEPVDLRLTFDEPLHHWTAYESNSPLLTPLYSLLSDIKFLWEPARFGWAFTLGRAHLLSGDDAYAEAFWRYTETFLDANPPYLGPHWMSGQEVALRLMAFAWVGQVFDPSPASTPERKARLAEAVTRHASRITQTLLYARSQNNNHLLTEAAGLLTAGMALPEHPQAARWRKLGNQWLDYGFRRQIDGYGEYSQHSTNYHRLMLQVALWVSALNTKDTKVHKGNLSDPLCPSCLKKVTPATHWLLALVDTESGRAPNLGANDGAYIFPLTVCPFADFRPVTQAAARAFLDYDLPRGPWDEMSLWFGIPLESKQYLRTERYLGDHLYARNSWAYLRTAQFTSRPSHADQLHLDLWWRGLNVAQDAGTYLYNAAPPWDNSLTAAQVHNTVTVDGRDQFTRAGRFLYLDWVNAFRKDEIAIEPDVIQRVCGRYLNRRRGYRHTRTVTAFADDRWRVEDEMLITRGPISSFILHPSSFTLHWLLPDWEWQVENRDSRVEISLQSPLGVITLAVETNLLLSSPHSQISLARAGELLYGASEVSPIMGWVSPTYGVKIPALSFAIEITAAETVIFTSEFTFPA
jgi:hypothetical protein